jgi:hypothetical protein
VTPEADEEDSSQKDKEDIPQLPEVNISVNKSLRAIIVEQVPKTPTVQTKKHKTKGDIEQEPAKKKPRGRPKKTTATDEQED